ncbi:MAG: hypothetical protein IPO09_19020 [Anaeromyxobacter sp.]|nr:hypothetical protein [Anaeromyxobacter sp.]MBL0276010.1 hypothetical protein [Anaeromyxobacter sp.]
MSGEPAKVSGDEAPPATAPAVPSGPVAAPTPSVAPAPLTPYQKRKAREEEREKRRVAARERRAAAQPTKEPAPAAAEPGEAAAEPVTDPGIPFRTSEVRLRDLALAWRVVWRVAGFLAGWFGYDLDPLTDKEAGADAVAFLPIAERFAVVDRAVTWTAAPAVLVERLATKLRRRPVEAAK